MGRTVALIIIVIIINNRREQVRGGGFYCLIDVHFPPSCLPIKGMHILVHTYNRLTITVLPWMNVG